MTNIVTHCVYLSLGSNLGQRDENIRKVVALIAERVGRVERLSSLLTTEPWGFSSPNAFVNAAVRCSTTLSPHRLLAVTQQIEREMGRTEKSVDGHYHDRVIDIDILLYDDLHLDTPELKIPHPLMEERDFVMVPLREILLPEAER